MPKDLSRQEMPLPILQSGKPWTACLATWKQVGPESLPQAMSAPDRSSAAPQPSARAEWRWKASMMCSKPIREDHITLDAQVHQNDFGMRTKPSISSVMKKGISTALPIAAIAVSLGIFPAFSQNT